MDEIAKVAVIGAGVMGAGIATLFANAGLSVTLLDSDPCAAATAISRQLASGGFADPALAERVRTGSSVADIELIADADWIVEAAPERLAIKRQIFAAIETIRKRGAIVSSNTSTIRLAQLVEGMEPADAQDYLITHFFNPPRVMRLLELVAGPLTRPEAVARIAALSGQKLDRCVVHCRDTPGFIANRIGNFWMAVAVDEAVRSNIDIEDADAVIGAPFGTPAGIFSLLDLVGIDLLPAGWRSLQSDLSEDDPLQLYPAEPPLISAMIADGHVGRKAGSGFYRKDSQGRWQALDLRTRIYRSRHPASSPVLDASQRDLRSLMEDGGAHGRFAWAVMGRTLAYAASLIPEIADTPDQIDQAMREGYGWKQGPFELIEKLGPQWFIDHLVTEGLSVPAFLQDLADRSSAV
jgi:3-hydroxyacyl-CoA dehydrogenase